MGTNTFNVHALFQLHRIWTSRCRTLSRMHQRAEIVSRMFPNSIFFLKWAFPHSCPARECHGTHKCQGHIVDSKIVKSGHLEDCISFCGNSPLCEHYTLEKKHDHCLLYKECFNSTYCDTCATGHKDCSRGYHGILKIGCLCIFSSNPQLLLRYSRIHNCNCGWQLQGWYFNSFKFKIVCDNYLSLSVPLKTARSILNSPSAGNLCSYALSKHYRTFQIFWQVIAILHLNM